ncbi:SigE family RNA polymerase sigma factor [Nocardioides mangrovicus]|uniref:SigE family RNA polymerase sigma factor n=1 Tax=Nocardioides mangrovicus TaxID=2478913 RepID=A0A3L8P3C1_9ACTN|nr:SigE family RNA polymerase sigma factor [Nocardioides mangrovicus]RLV49860.1 SigE family RNA polymerase sigma factor [Nocardioides mangrovicus]
MIASHDRRAFEEFVRGSSDRLLRTAYLMCGDRGHAEDLVQTTLLRTARRWRAARRTPEAYARRVLVNLAKDRWRGLSRRPVETAWDGVPEPVSVETGADPTVLDVVRLLPPGQRTVLVLRYFEGLSVEETAQTLGCSTGTVKSQTSRALERLRHALTEQESPC